LAVPELPPAATTALEGRGIWVPEVRRLTAGLALLITAIAFEGLAVTTVLPVTVAELGGLELYGWAFSAFFLTNLVGIALAGQHADRHGPMQGFVVGVVLFAGGLAIAGLAPSMPVVLAGRIVQGFGAGAIGAIAYVSVARGYPRQAMPKMIAVLSSAWVLPGLVGPLLAGTIADHLTWRWVFLGLIPLLLPLSVLVAAPLRRLGRSPSSSTAGPTSRPVDAILLAAGSASLLAALTIGHPLAAAVLLILGGWAAVHALRRLFPPGTLLVRHGRAAAVAFMFLVSFAFFGAETFVPLAVITVRGEPSAIGGLALTTASVTWAIGSWVQARLAPTHSRRAIIGAGIGIVIAGLGVMSLVLLPTMSVLTAPLGWAVAGFGIGLAYSTLALVVLEEAEEGREGAASAALQLANVLGIALGAGVGGAFVALAALTDLALATGIGMANGAMVLVALMALVLIGRIPARPHHALLAERAVQPVHQQPPERGPG
jgi:MFS family permease